MESQKSSDLLGCYETGHAIVGWQYASEAVTARLVSFVLMATLLLALILDSRTTSPERPTGPNLTVPRSTVLSLSHVRFLAWVATSAARGRLEVLFIEQKSLREQLTEILQEIEDYTWTEDGLANFSIKISS